MRATEKPRKASQVTNGFLRKSLPGLPGPKETGTPVMDCVECARARLEILLTCYRVSFEPRKEGRYVVSKDQKAADVWKTDVCDFQVLSKTILNCDFPWEMKGKTART